MTPIKIKRGAGFRGRVGPGDIFAIEIRSRGWLSGRVIRNDANAFAIDKLFLVYIYKVVYSSVNMVLSQPPGELLIPPLLAARAPWSYGLFQPCGSRPLVDSEVLGRHCFYSTVYETHYDEFSNEVRKSKPTGSFGVHGDKSIEEDIVEALSGKNVE